jgi:hypothetical protein
MTNPKFPVDFEQKVRLPPLVNGRSYPYQISAKDLMDDFRYSALQVDENEVNGLSLQETISGDGIRTVKLASQSTEPAGLIITHPFRVTYDVSSDTYAVTGGDCGGIEISNQTITISAPEFLYVKIERNTSSRVVIDATLEQGETIPTSTEEFQYIAIAYLAGQSVTQHRFEDIRLTEFLISDAGELKLVSVFDTTNTYDLP